MFFADGNAGVSAGWNACFAWRLCLKKCWWFAGCNADVSDGRNAWLFCCFFWLKCWCVYWQKWCFFQRQKCWFHQTEMLSFSWWKFWCFFWRSISCFYWRKSYISAGKVVEFSHANARKNIIVSASKQLDFFVSSDNGCKNTYVSAVYDMLGFCNINSAHCTVFAVPYEGIGTLCYF